MGEGKRGYLFRERPTGEGSWGSWKVAELGIPSLLAKAQHRSDEYEVEEIMPVAEHTQALATARQQERDGARRLALAVEAVTRAAHKLLDDTDEDGRSFLVDRQALEAAIAGAGADVAEVLGDEAPTIPAPYGFGLSDVEHVEAVALINGLLDYSTSLPAEVRAGAQGWLEEHRPEPTAYLAALRAMTGDPECTCGHTAHFHAHGGHGDCEHNAGCSCKKFILKAAG